MPVNHNKYAMEPRNYTKYFNILAFAVVTFISMGLLITPFVGFIIYPLAVYYYVKSNININWWRQRVVILLFSVFFIHWVIITFNSYNKGLTNPYLSGILYLSWLALALANFYFIRKWKTKFIETITFAISKKEFISWLSAATIISCFIFSALGSVFGIH
ncbi:MAG: hypothetical protein ACYCY2_13035, partial [Acidithiobacillus ferriphilus]